MAAAAVKNKSLFELFAYSKRRGLLPRKAEVEECIYAEESNSAPACKTPNKDHSPSRISETPESLVAKYSPNTTLRSQNSVEKRKKRRKRRARISSSSDENCEPIHKFKCSKSETLLGDLPISKRSRNSSESDSHPLNVAATKVCLSEGRRNNGICHKPRKLLFDDQNDEGSLELLNCQKDFNASRALEERPGSDEAVSFSGGGSLKKLRKKKVSAFLSSETNSSEGECDTGEVAMQGKIDCGVKGAARRSKVNSISNSAGCTDTKRSCSGRVCGMVNGDPCDGDIGKGKVNSKIIVSRTAAGREEDSCWPVLPDSGWLSARRGGPPVRQKLLRFAFEKKLHKDTSRNCTASVGNGNSCSGGGLVDRERRSPTGSPETTTDDVVVRSPLTADTTLNYDDGSELESDSEPSIQRCHRRRCVRVVEDYDSTSEDEQCSVNSVKSSSSEHHQQLGEEDLELEQLECNSDSEFEDHADYAEEHKEKVLDFLNRSSLEELGNIPGCSQNKAKLIIDVRPFRNWEELVSSLESCSSNGLTLERVVDGCLCLFKEREMVGRLLSECQDISASIHLSSSGLTSAAGGGYQDTLKYPRQPLLLSTRVELKPYQLVGLNWLTLLHSRDLNGILADEMGLGKTVQAIAFLAHLVENGCCGPFLIVVPSSTIENWSRELEKWCPSLKVLVYHGSAEERLIFRYRILSDEGYHVILSTYKLCVSQLQDRKFLQKLSVQCLVLDEGHMVKNMASRRYSHLMKIKASRRLLLTGTPLQNNLQELMSLLSFVMPKIFQDFTEPLRKTFSRVSKKVNEVSSYYKDQVSKAKEIMQPFILRRLKADVLEQLPSKVQETVFCQLSGLQLQLYTSSAASSSPSHLTPSSKVSDEDMSRSLSAMMMLRKIAMHPLLVRHRYGDDLLRDMAVDILKDPAYSTSDEGLVYEDMTVMSDFELDALCKKTKVLDKYGLPTSVLDDSAKLAYLKGKLKELQDAGSRVLLFSQFTMMLDVLEAFLQQHGHTYLRLDGATPIAERQPLMDRYNSDSSVFIFLLSTKAGGLGVNLTSANVVILHDIDFNPYNDKQAEDRCHRVGQTRDVSVLRLICKDTVEEEMLRCAEKKLKLEQDVCQIQVQSSSRT